QHAEHVDVHDLAEVLLSLLVRRHTNRALDAGVVERIIQPAEFFHRRVHDGADFGFAARVAADEHAFAAGFVDEAHGFLAFVLTPAAHDDLRAFTRKSHRGGTTDSGRAARDHRHFVFQSVLHNLADSGVDGLRSRVAAKADV